MLAKSQGHQQEASLHGDFLGQNISNALYGLQSLGDSEEVDLKAALIEALTGNNI